MSTSTVTSGAAKYPGYGRAPRSIHAVRKPARLAPTALHNPGFAEFARLCGAWGRRVERPDDLEDALVAALAQTGPALVEISSDPDLV